MLHSKTNYQLFLCQTGALCRAMCLLALVLFNTVIDDLNNVNTEYTFQNSHWQTLGGKNQRTTFKKYYGNGE